MVVGGSKSSTSTGPYAAGTPQGTEVVKNAFIRAKYDRAFVVELGASSMPWIPFVEDIYGQRYVEKTLTDTNKVANSADWGAFVHGEFLDGILGYSFAAVDGAGYKTPDRSNSMDFEGRVNVNYKGFVAAAGGYTGKEALNVNGAGTAVSPGIAPVLHTATRQDAVVAYVNPLFRVGFEYFKATNWKVLTKTAGDKQDGYSAFATYNFLPKWSAFGRYDWGKPTTVPYTTGGSAEHLSYYNIGIQYEPVKVIDLALVYKRDSLDHAVAAGYTDANAAMIPLAAGGSVTYDEVGLFTQFRF